MNKECVLKGGETPEKIYIKVLSKEYVLEEEGVS